MLALANAVDYFVGNYPTAVATADFNNDGLLDLAATVGLDNRSRVSVRLGNGAGAFGPAQEFAAPGYDTPSSLFIADLNDDGRPDMVVSEFNSFSTLIGNGDGAFQSAVSTFGLSMAAVGHYYNDSSVIGLSTWLDGDWATHLQLHAGDGQGGFFPLSYDTQYWGYSGMVPVDLNHDGLLDVVTGEGQVFMGGINGSLEFGYQQQAPLAGGAVTTGDFNGDENADVVVAGAGVAVLRGRGDGSLDAPILHAASGTFSAVATADFNGDGKLDVVVTDRNAATVSVLLGNGDGTLRFAGAAAVGNSPSGLTVGDFNGDSRPDVAVANSGSQTMAVLLNDGEWGTVPPPPPTISIGDTTLTEGNSGTSNATFTVTLAHAAPLAVSVNYQTTNITATELSDYTAASGTLTIPAGQTSGTFAVAIKGDRIGESTETFRVDLSNPINAPIADGQGICTILDNEPQISIGDVTKSEGKNGATTLFTFTVTLSAAYDQPVTMSFRTVNGTATASNKDFNAKTGTLTFAAGETTKTITIEVKGDSRKEGNEIFYLDLFGNSSNSQLKKSRGIGTILNDD